MEGKRMDLQDALEMLSAEEFIDTILVQEHPDEATALQHWEAFWQRRCAVRYGTKGQ